MISRRRINVEIEKIVDAIIQTRQNAVEGSGYYLLIIVCQVLLIMWEAVLVYGVFRLFQ